MTSGLYDCPSHNMLEEALGFTEGDDALCLGSSLKSAVRAGGGGGCGTVVLIEDCVETSGAFILHHLIRRSLSPNCPSDVVVFVSFAHLFSHYDRILRKMVLFFFCSIFKIFQLCSCFSNSNFVAFLSQFVLFCFPFFKNQNGF